MRPDAACLIPLRPATPTLPQPATLTLPRRAARTFYRPTVLLPLADPTVRTSSRPTVLMPLRRAVRTLLRAHRLVDAFLA